MWQPWLDRTRTNAVQPWSMRRFVPLNDTQTSEVTSPVAHVLIDAVGVRAGSAAITLENLLRGWSRLDADDRLTILCDVDLPFAVPDGAEVRVLEPPVGGTPGQVWLRSVALRRTASDLAPDAVVSGVSASALLGTRAPRGVILYDLRHELRPHQFSRGRRLSRNASYAWSFRNADAICCISRRTRDDLVRLHPWAAPKAVVARYGADHVDAWPAPPADRPRYALAFGHFANKNVDAVLDAWAEYCRAGDDEDLILRLVGMGRADREAATARVAALGIADRVELMPWLDDDEFVATFAGASLVLFPSDFEGFGLPAIEALRLGIPLVVSSDPALVEVTGGHAAVTPDVRPHSIVTAVREALALTSEQREAGQRHTDAFRWEFMAQSIRDALLGAGSAAGEAP